MGMRNLIHYNLGMQTSTFYKYFGYTCLGEHSRELFKILFTTEVCYLATLFIDYLGIYPYRENTNSLFGVW